MLPSIQLWTVRYQGIRFKSEGWVKGHGTCLVCHRECGKGGILRQPREAANNCMSAR